ncbi:MAG TPA: PQQ-dependent sugar dehydrogenase [Chryseolinea sp.]|nr:PQQ-dependent sugar dehydrogenase [Chryseolinea sp.]
MKSLSVYWRLLFSLLISPAWEGCGQDRDRTSAATPAYQIVVAFPKLSFQRPVDLQHPGDNTNRIFVVDQPGEIHVFQNEATTSAKKLFLDIKSKVDDSGNEEGLLGLAFHPEYKSNGYFYVNYTASNPNRTVISRFKVSSDADKADPSSEFVILEFRQPYSNHNGGQVSFGPDGFLYIATGDGGSGGDPHGNGQDKAALLGKILRIDVDHESNGMHYAIPADNPFARSSDYRKEIYAFGLRNPWRFSFDAVTKSLWTGDVGQNAYEEIDIIVKGGNYGWNTMEGKHCYEPSRRCKTSGLLLPIWEYDRGEGVSVTGGFVYRGAALQALKGKYVFADYGSGNIWVLDPSSVNNPVVTKLAASDLHIASFGVDQNNELYLCADGKIHRFQQR